MSIVIFRDKKIPEKPWIRYFLRRIEMNQNNLVVIIGKTGGGKTWAGLSCCEMISKKNKVPFGVDNVVFSLKELMSLINSGKLKKGSSILFDEPQCSISAREWQTETNRIFNYLLSTFRHRCLNLFFATPYEDLLDLSTRKLFHAKFQTAGINLNTQTCKIRPKTIEYNSQNKIFYEKWLRVCYKPQGSSSYVTRKYQFWDIPKPSDELIKLYEMKKLEFTTQLNKEIEERLNAIEAKKKGKPKEQLTISPFQGEVLSLWVQGIQKQREIARILGKSYDYIRDTVRILRDKGILPKKISIEGVETPLPAPMI